MTITRVPLTGRLTTPIGDNAGKAEVILEPNAAMVDLGTQLVLPERFILIADEDGIIDGQVELYACDDPGVLPDGLAYRVLVNYRTAETVELTLFVPHTAETVDISSATPGAPSEASFAFGSAAALAAETAARAAADIAARVYTDAGLGARQSKFMVDAVREGLVPQSTDPAVISAALADLDANTDIPEGTRILLRGRDDGLPWRPASMWTLTRRLVWEFAPVDAEQPFMEFLTPNMGGIGVTPGFSGSRIIPNGARILGPQFAVFRTGERGIQTIGATVDAPVEAVDVDGGLRFERWGRAAWFLPHAHEWTIEEVYGKDVVYEVFKGQSVKKIRIRNFHGENIVGLEVSPGVFNSYGCGFSREETDDLTADPPSGDCAVQNGWCYDNPFVAFDTHAGIGIHFTNVHAIRCLRGFSFGSSQLADETAGIGAKDCSLTNFSADSGRVDGKAQIGINVAGQTGGVGHTVDPAENIRIADGTIKGYGIQDNTSTGGAFFRDTVSLMVHDVKFSECQNSNVILSHDNIGYDIDGITGRDVWSRKSSSAVHVNITGPLNQGRLAGLSGYRGTKGTTAVAVVSGAAGPGDTVPLVSLGDTVPIELNDRLDVRVRSSQADVAGLRIVTEINGLNARLQTAIASMNADATATNDFDVVDASAATIGQVVTPRAKGTLAKLAGGDRTISNIVGTTVTLDGAPFSMSQGDNLWGGPPFSVDATMGLYWRAVNTSGVRVKGGDTAIITRITEARTGLVHKVQSVTSLTVGDQIIDVKRGSERALVSVSEDRIIVEINPDTNEVTFDDAGGPFTTQVKDGLYFDQSVLSNDIERGDWRLAAFTTQVSDPANVLGHHFGRVKSIDLTEVDALAKSLTASGVAANVSARVKIDSPAGKDNDQQFLRSGILRWLMRHQGSDDSFRWDARDLAGNVTSVVLTVDNATGKITVTQPLAVPTAVAGGQAVNKTQMDAADALRAPTPAVSTQTGNFTAVAGGVYEVNATSGNVVATVPVTSGLKCIIKKVDASANTVSITPASGTIDGAASIVLSAQYEARECCGDGTNVVAVSERKVFGSPVAIGTANSDGTSTRQARENHVHAHPVISSGDLHPEYLTPAEGNAAYAPLVETVAVVAASGAAQTIPDPAAGTTVSRITLTANCTFTFPTAAAGKSFTLVLVQDGTGSRTATWPGTVKWAAGTAPTLSTGAAKIDYLTFVCTDGTNWAGFLSGLDLR